MIIDFSTKLDLAIVQEMIYSAVSGISGETTSAISAAMEAETARTESTYLKEASFDNYATKEWVGQQGYLTSADTENFLTSADTKDFLTSADTVIFLTSADTENFTTSADTQSAINSALTGYYTSAQTQDAINAAYSSITGVLNLTYATSGQVQEALTNKWAFSIDYSGETYIEQLHRNFQNSISVIFYVQGAYAAERRKIYDRILSASVSLTAYTVTTAITDYVPDIIYDLTNMTTDQLKALYERTLSENINGARFSAVWDYNDEHYVCCGRFPTITGGMSLLGSTGEYGITPYVFYDVVYISSDGTILHTEYQSNITFTPVQ